MSENRNSLLRIEQFQITYKMKMEDVLEIGWSSSVETLVLSLANDLHIKSWRFPVVNLPTGTGRACTASRAHVEITSTVVGGRRLGNMTHGYLSSWSLEIHQP